MQKIFHATKQAGKKKAQNYPSRQNSQLSDLVCVLPMELYELGRCWARTGKTKPSPKLEQK